MLCSGVQEVRAGSCDLSPLFHRHLPATSVLIVEFTCDGKFHLSVCRHQQDHDCPKLVLPQKSMTATKAVVDEILSSAPAPPKTEKKVRSVKAQKTAAKVQLMKLKMKSIGDKSLPQEERIYFLVSVHYLYFTSSKYYSFELKV